MLTKLLFGVIVYFLIVLTLSVFLKRNFQVKYDRGVLLSSLFLLIAVFVIWLIPGIATEYNQIEDNQDRIAWMILIIVGSNALLKLLSWLVYTFIRKNDLVRMPRFMFNIVSGLFLIGIALYALGALFHTDLSGILVTSTVLSAIIGLSLQDTLTNLFAGVSLQVESPFSNEEWVSLGGQEGKVVSQNWRSLTLLTRENHRITLPNNIVAKEMIINYSRPTVRQIHSFNVELDYEHPPNQVKKILKKLLIEIKETEIDKDVGPYIVSYGASGITYCLKFWINDYSDVHHIQDVVLTRMWYALNRHDIKIPYTISEVRMDLKTEETEKARMLETKNFIQLKLSQQPWLSEMKEEQIQVLVEKARLEKYCENEDLVIQGADGDSMFIILKGTVKILVRGSRGREVHVADKYVGDFFGEMSLLSGDPRTATVRANEDMEVIVIDKEAFTEVLLKDSRILDTFVNALEANKSSLTTIIEEERKKSKITKYSARKVIMNKIKSYLNIGK